MNTYEESVLSYADGYGNLTRADAVQLLGEHGFTLGDVYEDDHGVSAVHLDERNAEALLACERSEGPVELHELREVALLHNLTEGHAHDEVGVADGGEAV